MKIKKGVQAVGLFIGFYILLQGGLYFLLYFFPSILLFLRSFTSSGGGLSQTLFLIFFQSLLFLFLFYVSFVRRNKQTKKGRDVFCYMRKRWQRKGWRLAGKYVLGGLSMYFLFNIVFGGLIQHYHLDIPGFYGEQLVITFLQGIDATLWWEKLVLFFLVVFLGPFVEEVIRRGFVTDRLMKSRQGEGVFLAALLFAVAHLEWGVVWNLVILSLCLGYIYRKTGSLWYSFMFHIIINGLAMGIILGV